MNVSSRAYIDSLYDDFQNDPGSLPKEWQEYFQNFDPSTVAIDSDGLPPKTVSAAWAEPGTESGSGVAQLQDRVDQLIRGFRVRGHLEARIDPLGRPRAANSELEPGILRTSPC